MRNQVVTYEPDNSIKKGFFAIFPSIYQELTENKWLTFQLFIRDFATMYKQSFIGILWIFIVPLINVLIFTMLNHSGIFNVGEITVPYPLYGLLGMAFWQLFSTGVTTGGNSLTQAGDMITRINFSKKSLVIASTGRAVLSFFIQILFILLLFAFFRITPAKTLILAPLVLIPIMFLTLGLGFILALLNAVIRDTGNFLSLAMTLLMYATPVLYSKPLKGLLLTITRYNPMYYFIATGRDLALHGRISELNGFILSSLVSMIIFSLSIAVFHLTETRVAERI